MAKSVRVTAKRMSRTSALYLEEVKLLGSELLSSRVHQNHAPPSSSSSTRGSTSPSRRSSHSSPPSSPSTPSAAAAGDACRDPERVFGSWLRQRFDEMFAALVAFSVPLQSGDAIKEAFCY